MVKGIHLEGLRVLGKPEEFARYYYEMGADELIYIDIVASLYNRNSLLSIISKAAQEIFIPLTVGGGLRNIDDIRNALKAGADKVSLNTIAINNPKIVKEAVQEFGSSTIVISIEAMKQPDGQYLAYTNNAREYTGLEVVKWAKQVQALGAGEILLTSIDKEGTGKGFDLDLTKLVSNSVSIPVIAHGGAGNTEDIVRVIKEADADAVALASMLHYEFLEKTRGLSKEFVKSDKIISCCLPAIKKKLIKNGLYCREVNLKKERQIEGCYS